MYTYQKALLYSYSGLKSKIREYDNLIDYTAVYSGLTSERCDVIAERILGYIRSRNILINVKQCLEKIVSNFTKDEKILFESKYLGKDKDLSKYGERQYFRKQNELLKNFSSTLNIYGLNEEWFNENAVFVPFLKMVYDRVSTSKFIRVRHRNSV